MSNKNLNIEQISLFEKENNIILPEIYVQFLKENNGLSLENGVNLFKFEELLETNDYLQVKIYSPNYIAIGDDGGDLIFLMEQSSTAVEVYIVDAGDYDIKQCYQKVSNFCEWLQNNCYIKNEYEKNISYGELIDIELVKKPQNGLKDLAKIKGIFNLDISTAEILNKTKNIPSIIVENISYGKAIKLIQKFNQPNIFKIKNKK